MCIRKLTAVKRKRKVIAIGPCCSVDGAIILLTNLVIIAARIAI